MSLSVFSQNFKSQSNGMFYAGHMSGPKEIIYKQMLYSVVKIIMTKTLWEGKEKVLIPLLKSQYLCIMHSNLFDVIEHLWFILTL